MFQITDEVKSILENQFIKWIDDKYVNTIEDIKSIININNYKYVPNYKIDLAIKYEQRAFVFNQIKPYEGEYIPSKVSTLLGEWEYVIDSSNDMNESENYYSINDSYEKEICPTCQGDASEYCPECDGEGKLVCENCKGKGKVWCDWCNGTGKEECSSCDGRGYKTVTSGGRQKRERCRSCNGKGEIYCRHCDGRREIECSTCDGYGEITCDSCNGEGIVYCKTCKGASNILRYTVLKQKCDILNESGFFFNSEIPNTLKDLIIKNKIFENIVTKTISFNEGDITAFIEAQDIPVQDLLKGLIGELSRKIPENSKITKIQFDIFICKLFSLDIGYSNKNYSWYSYNGNCFFEKNDIRNKIRGDLNLHFYNKFYDEANYVEAYILLKKICRTKFLERAADLNEFRHKKKALKKNQEYKKQLKEKRSKVFKTIFPKIHQNELKRASEFLDSEPVDIDKNEIKEISDKNRTVVLLLCLFFGWLGVHRYYTKKIFTGIFQFISVLLYGLGLIWVAVDLILILSGKFKDKDKKYILKWK